MVRRLFTFPRTHRERRVTDLWCNAIATAFIVAAFLVARQAVDGLRGPFDPDLFRDIAQAQTVRDGHLLSDQYYAGEWAWYNPLIAWIAALGSALARTTVENFHTQSGPFLNLLGPIGFYVLAVRLADRRAALTGLALYLFFITGGEHSWASSTYSPWLFADNFSSGLFFWGVLIALWADSQLTMGRAIVAGVAVGVVFLAHSAPALVLALVLCALWWRNWARLAVAGLASIAVASPFLGPLIFHYRLHVLHSTPMAFNYPPVSKDGFLVTLRICRWYLVAAVPGLWLARRRPALLAWCFGALALTLYSLSPWRPIVPAFHFWVYTLAAVCVLAGWALSRLSPNPVPLSVILIILVAWNWSSYTTRNDLAVERRNALGRRAEHLEAVTLLRRITRPDDVVVGNYGAVRLIIGPSGRKTVAPDEYFANPYVEYPPRRQARDQMLDALAKGNIPAFRTLASQYGVTGFVLVGEHDCRAVAEKLPLLWMVRPDLCVGLTENAGGATSPEVRRGSPLSDASG